VMTGGKELRPGSTMKCSASGQVGSSPGGVNSKDFIQQDAQCVA
jgi:hypothetical protein